MNNLKQNINNFTNMNVIIIIDVSLIENGEAKPSSYNHDKNVKNIVNVGK